MENIVIGYEIQTRDEVSRVFECVFDARTLCIERPPPEVAPAWTALEFQQCTVCPLKAGSDPCCPLAIQLEGVINRFGHLISYQEVLLTVTTPERRVVQETTAQRALGSLLGLLMAVSGCPVTRFFRPMARFHLPLASEIETIYRATSMYLLGQYFRSLQGGERTDDLSGLGAIYADLSSVNRGIAARLRAAIDTDAAVGGVAILDLYTLVVPQVINEALADIEHLFAPYWNETSPGGEAPCAVS